MLRLPHFLDSRLTNGGEVVSLTGHIAAGKIRSIEKCNDLTGKSYALFLMLVYVLNLRKLEKSGKWFQIIVGVRVTH
jgi:hypothetical protein